MFYCSLIEIYAQQLMLMYNVLKVDPERGIAKYATTTLTALKNVHPRGTEGEQTNAVVDGKIPLYLELEILSV